MKISLAHPAIAPHVKQNVMAYAKAGILSRFYTTFYHHPQNRLSNTLKYLPFVGAEIERRGFHHLPVEKFTSRPWPELLRISASRWAGVSMADRIWEWAETGFDTWVAKNISIEHPDIIHVYEHAALAALTTALNEGIFSVYEQSSAHHTAFSLIIEEQMARYPELKNPVLDLKTNEKAKRRNARRDQELKLADVILCNSGFTKKTLVKSGVDPKRIEIIPLGFPLVNHPEKPKKSGPVIFLHAGNQSLTKASHIVYEAWKKCRFSSAEAELWLIGKMTLPEKLRHNLPGKVVIRPNIPRHEMDSVYALADVLLSPSLADGFGMVITEAMANGVPVIASENCCGPDVITSGKNGWIVRAGDVEHLTNTMRECVSNRNTLSQAGYEAAQKALTWQWEDYRKALVERVHNRWEKA